MFYRRFITLIGVASFSFMFAFIASAQSIEVTSSNTVNDNLTINIKPSGITLTPGKIIGLEVDIDPKNVADTDLDFWAWGNEITPLAVGGPTYNSFVDAGGSVAYSDTDGWTISFGNKLRGITGDVQISAGLLIANLEDNIPNPDTYTKILGYDSNGILEKTTPSTNTFVFNLSNPILNNPSIYPSSGIINLKHNESFKLSIDAGNFTNYDLYSLEVDHSLEGTLPEFHLYAVNGDGVYGNTPGHKDSFLNEGITASYQNGKWNIDFGQNITKILADNGITFYLALKNSQVEDNYIWGDMNQTSPENTFTYTIDISKKPQSSGSSGGSRNPAKQTELEQTDLGKKIQEILNDAKNIENLSSSEKEELTKKIVELIVELQKQIKELQSKQPVFYRDLYVGDTGPDVLALQKFLNQNGFIVGESGAGSIGLETDYFAEKTRQAVAKYQIANGISPANGRFGPATRQSVLSKQ